MGEKGTAQIDVAPDVVAIFVAHLPRAFTIIGTERCDDGPLCRFIVESAEIAPGTRTVMTMEIEDRGLTRSVSMVPRSSGAKIDA